MKSWHRFYDPTTGRYITADPIGLAGGMNLYAYVQNDPVNWIDPEGKARIIVDSRCTSEQLKNIYYRSEEGGLNLKLTGSVPGADGIYALNNSGKWDILKATDIDVIRIGCPCEGNVLISYGSYFPPADWANKIIKEGRTGHKGYETGWYPKDDGTKTPDGWPETPF